MQKIVINKCYGGFGLSPRAIKRYLELDGKEYFRYTERLEEENGEYTHRYEKIGVDDEAGFMDVTTTIDNGDELDEFPKVGYFYENDIERDDPKLVQVVEEMGDDADGNYAELRIVEVPDGVSWIIDEYDGIEWIAETHQTWG